MTVLEMNAVVREIRIAARPETIFPFFTDPEKMVRWMGTRAVADPRPGGVYEVDVTPQALARGAYVEVAPFSRVVFTFGWEGEGNPVPPGSTTVEITLTPDGDETVVRLVHRDLPVDQRPMHTQGWEHYLGRLGQAAAGGDPGVDPWTQGPPAS